MLVLITYDLIEPNRNYEDVHEAIKECGDAWCHILESVWLVHTNNTIEECYNNVIPHMQKKDKLFIVDITYKKKYSRLPSKFQDWINEYDF